MNKFRHPITAIYPPTVIALQFILESAPYFFTLHLKFRFWYVLASIVQTKKIDLQTNKRDLEEEINERWIAY
ncbi:hypothetical protein HanXRQr2_Chr03g0103121 [Helianthus annuus]|uniref:Uncharacterized protein n=1 Tax=Helianthus annuus TaxID=4232 RepID=A0A251V7K3_HELAN|nr:hypothetical protein HanXRQr2_Chr03g0103121 [Helianthus annuus]KAJ0943069.1 hypothetical protein HanPSC8_Chr03g0099611 [Helianthus annuus]